MLLAVERGQHQCRLRGVHDGAEWRGRWRIATRPDGRATTYAVWLLTLMQLAGLRPADIPVR
jgi:type III pantothenate kinase